MLVLNFDAFLIISSLQIRRKPALVTRKIVKILENCSAKCIIGIHEVGGRPIKSKKAPNRSIFVKLDSSNAE